jgi:hypothetical protein
LQFRGRLKIVKYSIRNRYGDGCVEKISVFTIGSVAHVAWKNTAVFLRVDYPVFIQSKLYHRSAGLRFVINKKGIRHKNGDTSVLPIYAV